MAIELKMTFRVFSKSKLNKTIIPWVDDGYFFVG